MLKNCEIRLGIYCFREKLKREDIQSNFSTSESRPGPGLKGAVLFLPLCLSLSSLFHMDAEDKVNTVSKKVLVFSSDLPSFPPVCWLEL